MLSKERENFFIECLLSSQDATFSLSARIPCAYPVTFHAHMISTSWRAGPCPMLLLCQLNFHAREVFVAIPGAVNATHV